MGSIWSMGIVRSASSRTTRSTQLKKTCSPRRLWSIPDENDPQDQSIDGLPTPAKTPIPPRVLPGRKRLENGASSINSVIAAIVSTSTTRTDSSPRPQRYAKPYHVEREQPKPSPAVRQVQQCYQVRVGLCVDDLGYSFERHDDVQMVCRRFR
jgi:hypothetical protein